MPALPQIHQDQVANDIYEAAARMNDSEKPRNYLGMSQIGAPCDRALWYQFRQFSPRRVEGRIKMIWELGDLIEAKIIQYLLAAGYEVTGIHRQVVKILRALGVEVEDQDQLRFSAHNDWFGGHCDGQVHGVTRRVHILECKSAKASKFKSIKQGGIRRTYPVYYCQGQLYMGYAGLERILWVVYNKDTSEIYTERGYFNLQDFEALNNRAFHIITANQPPPRIKDDPGSFECAWCDYKTLCWTPENHTQRWLTCGSCERCRFQGLTATCQGQEIPRDWWGQPCRNWTPNPDVLVPF